MANSGDLQRIAMALPGVTGHDLSFGVGKKALCWLYLARDGGKGRREPVPGVVAVRCELSLKELLIEAAPDRYFDDDHYRGYPAVLMRLDALDTAEVADRLLDAWRLQAPARLRRASGQ